MELTALTAFLLVMVPMVLGEIASTKTKAFVPSVFVTAILFLFGFWFIFPKELIKVATLGQPVAGLCIFLLITHMGTLMNVKELLLQWRSVLIALAGVVGIIILLLTVGSLVLGRDAAIVGAPPLTGGILAAILMQGAAQKAGNEELAVLAILVYVVQGFVGYPLTAILLKKEGKKLLSDYQSGIKVETVSKNSNTESKTLIPKMPEKYNTTYMVLLKLAFVAFLADKFTVVFNMFMKDILHINFSLSAMVMCLIFGVISAEIGFLDRKPLDKAGAFGWMMTVLMAFVFEGLSSATPEMLGKVATLLVGVIVIGVIGLILFSLLVSKLLKESLYMGLCIALNALYGFPPNFILTTEAINSLTEKEDEVEYLTDIMMPKMLIGGFTSVTIASVIVAGIFEKLL